jgi:hypothetical protein
MEMEEQEKHNIFLYLLLGGIFIAVAASFYFFYFKKDFDFIVEVACDPAKEECIQRDCTNPDDCPPNGYSDFKRYTLNANDFEYCKDEDCKSVCENNEIKCTQIACIPDEEMGETCSTVEEENMIEEVLPEITDIDKTE